MDTMFHDMKLYHLLQQKRWFHLLPYMADVQLHSTEGRRGQGVQRGPAGAAVVPPADPDAVHPPGSAPLPGAQGEGPRDVAATCHATGSNLCYPACLCMCLGSSMSLSCPGAHIATRGSFHEVVALWPMVKVQP